MFLEEVLEKKSAEDNKGMKTACKELWLNFLIVSLLSYMGVLAVNLAPPEK